MRPKLSAAWRYFVEDPKGKNKATCLQCRAVVNYSGGTTNLRSHLLRHDGINLNLNTSNSKPVAVSMATSNNGCSSRRSVTSPWTLAARKLSNIKQNRITRAVTNYIIDDLRPFTTITSPSTSSLPLAFDFFKFLYTNTNGHHHHSTYVHVYCTLMFMYMTMNTIT